MYECVCVHAYICMYMRVCVCVHIYVFMHIYMYACVYMYIPRVDILAIEPLHGGGSFGRGLELHERLEEHSVKSVS